MSIDINATQQHVHLKGEHWTRPLVGLGRKRTSGDGFALEIRPVQPSQPVRTAQATPRGRRMPGTRGTLPRRVSESSRQ